MADTAREHAPRAQQRVALFDNLKGLLIILVVCGHIVHPVHNSNPVLSACFDVIYLFHMPMFVLISGLFAKSTYRDGHLNINRIISFAMLGLLFQGALLLVNGTPVTPLPLLRFPSAPWYLIAMAWWSSATPLLAKLRPVRGMAITLALSLLSGCIELEGGFLALGRTLAFAPWFALGYYASRAQLEHLRTRKFCWAAVAFASLIIAARIVDPHAYEAFIPMVYGDNPYEGTLVAGIASRITAMLVAAVCSLAILKLTPSTSGKLTVLGRRTLQIYVLHRLIRAALTFRTGFYDQPILDEPVAGTIILLTLSASVVYVTSWGALERPFNSLLSIAWDKLLDRRKR